MSSYQQQQPVKNAHELAALARFLLDYHNRKPTGAHFSLDIWYYELAHLSEATQISIRVIRNSEPPLECGFAACAIGHLPYAYPDSQICVGANNTVFYRTTEGNYQDTDAIEHYFNLTHSATLHLFSPDAYPINDAQNPTIVGQRLLDFLTAHAPESLQDAPAESCPTPAPDPALVLNLQSNQETSPFNQWLAQVDQLFETAIGFSTADLEDQDYLSMFEDDYTPQEAFDEVMENLGYNEF